MKNILSMACAVAIGLGTISGAPVASAAPIAPIAPQVPAVTKSNLTDVQWKVKRRPYIHQGQRWGKQNVYNGGRRYYRSGGHWRRSNNNWIGPAAGGLIAGALIGGALSGPSYYGDPYYYGDAAPRVIYRPAPRVYRSGGSAHVQWCYDHYRSYRQWDNTYQPYYGPRKQCVSPY